MKKSKMIIAVIFIFIFMLISCFYIWRYSPFLPHIDRQPDGTFNLNGSTYMEYNEVDFIEKFGHLKRGKKVAIINKTNELPWCSVYEAQGINSDNILIVFEEIIMSVDAYYTIK